MLSEEMKRQGYHVKEFYGIISGSMLYEIGKIHLEAIKDIIEKFRVEAVKKYETLDTAIGTKNTLKRIDYIFKRIEDLPIDADEVSVLTYAFGQLYQDLIKQAEEMEAE